MAGCPSMYQNRDDLEKAYIRGEGIRGRGSLTRSEASDNLSTWFPSFLWTSLPDGSKEYLQPIRWYDYTGLSLEEGEGVGWKVVVFTSGRLGQTGPGVAGSLLDSRKPGELEARIRRYDGVYRWFLIRVVPLLR